MDQTFHAQNLYFGFEQASLREIVKALRDTYCGTIGAEFMYISDPEQKRWWKEKLESIRSTPNFSPEKKKHILNRLTAAEGLERFLHTKYVGQKRFSLEGGESFIASMDEVVRHGGANGVQEIVIGMAHRGRLNVLVNTLGKMPADLFAEFEGKHVDDLPAGDVKYHKGFSSDVSTDGGPVHLSLAFNPSHLEIVNPVVEGSAKARMDRRGDDNGMQVLPVQIHGDAAFAGQGVVMETLNLAQTRGYGTHGTLHIVINNQIGFTTSDPRDSRSTLYCSDVVKMIEAPVLHVNGDDPEAVVLATQLAIDFRMQFHKDVVVDIICFRKLGHNEQDTPAVTQPLMYKTIAKHPGTRALYAEKLVQQGVITAAGRRRIRQGVPQGDGRRPSHDRPGALELQEQVRGRLGAVPEPQVDRRRRHGRAARGTEAPRRAHHHDPGELQGASAGRARDQRSSRDGPWRSEARLGHGRASGVRVAGRIGLRGASDGPGLGPRHVHAPSRGAARPEPRALERRHLRSAAEHRGRSGEVQGDRLGAVGRSGARLRVRLFDR